MAAESLLARLMLARLSRCRMNVISRPLQSGQHISPLWHRNGVGGPAS